MMPTTSSMAPWFRVRIAAAAFLASVTALATDIHVDGGNLWRASGQTATTARTPSQRSAQLSTLNFQRSTLSYGEWAMQAAEALKDRLGVTVAADELRVRSVLPDATGNVHVRLDQVYHGLPVRASQLVLHFTPDGTVYQVNGAFIPGISVSVEPAVARPEGGELVVWAPVGAEDGEDARLAWRTDGGAVWTFTDAQTGEWLGEERRRRRSSSEEDAWDQIDRYVEKYAPQARTNAFPDGVACTIRGELPRPLWTNDAPCVVEVPGIRGDDGYFYLCGTNRYGRAFSIWNADGIEDAYVSMQGRVADLPTAADANGIARYMSDDWGDFNPEAIAAAYHVISVMDYFQEEFGRASYRGEGATDARTCAFVCLPNKNSSGKVTGGYDNSFFYADAIGGSREPTGSGAMYFGYSKDGTTFQVLDVTGHEYSHAIAQNTAEFVYEGESGALDESFADIFGVGCEMFAQRAGPEYPAYEPQTADWFVGEDMGGVPLRDFVNPASTYVQYPQSAAYRDSHWADTYAYYYGDSGGVHINSGIQNRFFCLLQARIGVQAALQLAYLTVTGYCTSRTGFKQVAKLWESAASQLAGKTVNGVEMPSDARAAVAECWEGLLAKPTFAASKNCTFVGYMEELDLFAEIYVEKASKGKAFVKFTFEDWEGWSESVYGSLDVASGKATIKSWIGKVTLDFAADNVIVAWTVSRTLLSASTPTFTTHFTAFNRAPQFLPSVGDPDLLGSYVGVKTALDLYDHLNYTIGDGLDFSAKGLPSGLKIGKTSGMVSGVPKKAQKGTATITVKSWVTGKSASCKMKYDIKALPAWARRKYAAYAVNVATSKSAGEIRVKATGAGVISGRFKIGKKVWKFSSKGYGGDSDDGGKFTVSAKPKCGKKKGNTIFSITPDGIAGSATLAGVKYIFVGGYAIDVGLDAEPIQGTEVYLVPAGKASSIGVKVTADAPYTVTAKNLPSGLSLVRSGSRYSIAGTAKKPGELPKKLALTAKTYSVPSGKTFYFRLLVDNYHTDLIPTDEHYDGMQAGFRSEFFIEGATNCVVKGLPPGLRFDAATGRIYGISTAPGDYLVTFTRTVGKGKKAKTYKATALFRVEALPSWVRGSFLGTATNLQLSAGTAALSVSAAGKVSGKYMWTDSTSHGFATSQFAVDDGGTYMVTGGVTKAGQRVFSTDVTFGTATFPAADGGTVDRGVASLDTALVESPYEEDAALIGANGYFSATLLQNAWSVKGSKVPKFAFTKKVKKFVKKVPNVGGYDISLAFAASGKVTVTAVKHGKTKVLASSSTEVMLADYVPGEGWTGELAVVLPKLKIYRVFQVKIADVASVNAAAISVVP